MRKQSLKMGPSAGTWSADISGGDYEFGFRCVEFDMLVENINGNIDMARGNIDRKLRVLVWPGQVDMGFNFEKQGKVVRGPEREERNAQ